jgi:release factor glutamine methyltransferase
VIVHPEVFPPHLTLSTKIILDFLAPLELIDKRLLELGCGSGIISLYARQKGAIVTASDINPIALEYLEKASKMNELELRCVQSDLFDGLQSESFDYIIINPPYYPKQAKNIKEQAWFCGLDFEYFQKLFKQLPEFVNAHNQVYMILSEDCEIDRIKGIATDNNLSMTVIHHKKSVGEQNWIFEIQTTKGESS